MTTKSEAAAGVLSDFAPEWLAEFEAAARRPLALRMRYAFIKTYKPVMDDASYRAFDTTAEYRRWREENLPDWLGYGSVGIPAGGGNSRGAISSSRRTGSRRLQWPGNAGW